MTEQHENNSSLVMSVCASLSTLFTPDLGALAASLVSEFQGLVDSSIIKNSKGATNRLIFTFQGQGHW